MKGKKWLGLLLVMSLFLWGMSNAHAYQRFIDNGDGTITDRKTRLIGLKNANCFGKNTWERTMSSVQKLANGSCWLKDGSRPGSWRLINKNELSTLFDWSGSGVFSNVRYYIYWSNTSFDAPRAWYIHLNLGDVGVRNKTSQYYAWPVKWASAPY